jgi:NADH dehydrogenase
VTYDVLVMAAGSVARTLPIPGLAEHGVGFKNVGEAIFLRNHVLARLDAASSTDDPAVRQKALTFTFVGGGYAGVEAFAELEDMARYAIEHYYPRLSPSDMRWVLVEAMGRILPEVDLDMAAWTVHQLSERDMDVRLNTRLESISDEGLVRLSDGEEFLSETLVWTAGTKPNPMLAETDLPVDGRGRVECETTLQVRGMPDAWAAGDLAAVPDLTKDDPAATTAPNAQHAVRQAKRLADNIVAVLAGEEPVPYQHKYAGSVASLGLHKGVAQVYGVKLKGWPAWFMHRTYHVSRVPTFNRKARVIADWTLASLFRREVVSLGQLQDPRREFVFAANTGRAGHLPPPRVDADGRPSTRAESA